MASSSDCAKLTDRPTCESNGCYYKETRGPGILKRAVGFIKRDALCVPMHPEMKKTERACALFPSNNNKEITTACGDFYKSVSQGYPEPPTSKATREGILIKKYDELCPPAEDCDGLSDMSFTMSQLLTPDANWLPNAHILNISNAGLQKVYASIYLRPVEFEQYFLVTGPFHVGDKDDDAEKFQFPRYIEKLWPGAQEFTVVFSADMNRISGNYLSISEKSALHSEIPSYTGFLDLKVTKWYWYFTPAVSKTDPPVIIIGTQTPPNLRNANLKSVIASARPSYDPRTWGVLASDIVTPATQRIIPLTSTPIGMS